MVFTRGPIGSASGGQGATGEMAERIASRPKLVLPSCQPAVKACEPGPSSVREGFDIGHQEELVGPIGGPDCRYMRASFVFGERSKRVSGLEDL
jgi:hypothetical protein